MTAKFIAKISPDSYPALQWRKKLAARILIARNLSSKSRVLKGSILSTVNESARDSVRAKDDSLTLEKFLREILADAKHSANLPSKRTLSPRVTEAFNDFEQDLGIVSCYNCVKYRLFDDKKLIAELIEPSICNGTNDEPNLTDRAACLYIITSIFGMAVQLAEESYRTLLKDAEIGLTISIKFRATEEKSLGASTTLRDREGMRIAIIEVKLPAEDFDHHQYFNLPYYIFHEVCVHAPEAWDYPGSRPLLVTPSTCPLREGFVDAAAAHILDRALSQNKLGIEHDRFKEEFQLATQTSSLSRAIPRAEVEASDLSRDQFMQEITEARHRGQVLFLKIASEIGDDAAADLALALNLLSLDDNRRDQLVAELTLALDPRPVPAGSGEGAPIAEASIPAFLRRLTDAAQAGRLRTLREAAESLIRSPEF
jgi:hypothetical protein